MTRLCANPACNAPLDDHRSDARACSGACRAEVSRLGGVEAIPGSVRFWAGVASRNVRKRLKVPWRP